jgi:hypothetical protein
MRHKKDLELELTHLWNYWLNPFYFRSGKDWFRNWDNSRRGLSPEVSIRDKNI